MSTTGELFNEFAAALQFPYYFGNNWGAFDECLADLSWMPATHYVLAILDSAELLSRDSEDEMDHFLCLLERICTDWSKPIVGGNLWDRPSVPFHVLFHSDASEGHRLHNQIHSMSLTLDIHK